MLKITISRKVFWFSSLSVMNKLKFSTGIAIPEAKAVLKKAQAVCFDVDSTVIKEEGIDVLADYLGAGAAVAELTKKAMGGSVLFQDALQARLSLIKPSKKNIEDCLIAHPFQFTPTVELFIEKLHKRGTYVYLVSGGFRQMINPIADKLNIPRHVIMQYYSQLLTQY